MSMRFLLSRIVLLTETTIMFSLGCRDRNNDDTNRENNKKNDNDKWHMERHYIGDEVIIDNDVEIRMKVLRTFRVNDSTGERQFVEDQKRIVGTRKLSPRG